MKALGPSAGKEPVFFAPGVDSQGRVVILRAVLRKMGEPFAVHPHLSSDPKLKPGNYVSPLQAWPIQSISITSIV
jgi:hypothetical protein